MRATSPTAGATDRTTPRAPGRRVVALAIGLAALNLRAAIGVVPPLLDRISGDVGLSTVAAGLLGSTAPAAFALAGLLVPRLVGRAAPERLLVAALGLSALAQLARGLAGSGPAFLALTAVALLGLGLGNVLMPVLVKTWFPDRIALLSAGYITLVTLGTAVPAALAVPVADLGDAMGTEGWRLSLAVWGVAAAVVLPLWWRPARRPRSTVPARGAVRVRLAVWRSRTAWGITLVFGMCALHIYALVQWLPARLVDAGLSEAAAGTAMAVFAATGLPGAVAVPFLVARFPGATAWLVGGAATCFAAGDLGLMLAPTAAPLVWAGVAGLGGAGFPAALTLVGLRTRTPAAAGVVSGFSQGVGYALAVLGPLSFGVLHDRTGRWTAPFAGLLAVTAVMVVGGVLAGGRRHVEDDVRARTTTTPAPAPPA